MDTSIVPELNKLILFNEKSFFEVENIKFKAETGIKKQEDQKETFLKEKEDLQEAIGELSIALEETEEKIWSLNQKCAEIERNKEEVVYSIRSQVDEKVNEIVKKAEELGTSSSEFSAMINPKISDISCQICQKEGEDTNLLKQVCSRKHLECSKCTVKSSICPECGENKVIYDMPELDKAIRKHSLLRKVKTILAAKEEYTPSINRDRRRQSLRRELKPVLQVKIEDWAEYTRNKFFYLAREDYIVEIYEERHKIVVKERQRLFEKQGFFCWIGNLEVNVACKRRQKEINLIKKGSSLDSQRIRASLKGNDRLFLRGNTIYAAVSNQPVLNRIQVENRKLVKKPNIPISDSINVVLEVGGLLFCAGYSGEIYCFDGKEVNQFVSVGEPVTDMFESQGILYIGGSRGILLGIEIKTKQEKHRSTTKQQGQSFIYNDKVLVCSTESIKIFDLSGNLLTEQENKAKENLTLIDKNEYFTALASETVEYLLVWQHSTSKLLEFETGPFII